ncbi:amino acid permease [Luteolibacter pohnpeiensis]|uniref:Amino acid permease n=1 Tax=Luteolibacter pohnpeiensis TaxID=454153 RepID=A0A934VU60_9BACT|nr:amino acid permease [Luteolibacter pohnpeiensis]MBK1880775.1 amino acid permease [Luteolibacter pohnpeiensis]
MNPVRNSGPGTSAATSLVVANMVGTGVFVSLGFQLLDFHSAPPILLLWVIGGVVALCGALTYAGLVKCMPRSGGEYHFLGTIYHPALGFMAGLMSAIFGFSVPTAITAIAVGGYLHQASAEIPERPAALVVILLSACAHGVSNRTSGRVQLFSTLLKLTLILLFIASAAILPGKGDIRWAFHASDDFAQIAKPAFATAVFYVFYSYSGWNAAVYGLEEWREPSRTVKRALLGGTTLVMMLYLALNISFLVAAPIAGLRGEKEIAHVAAAALFGEQTGRIVSGLFAVGLFASVSALLWAGPRVLAAMGRDVSAMRLFATKGEVPLVPLAFQSVLAIALVLLGDFEFLIKYTQTGLTLCTMLSAFGLILLKLRGKDIPPSTIAPALIFLLFTGFVMVRLFFAEPMPAACGLVTGLGCVLLWFPIKSLSK